MKTLQDYLNEIGDKVGIPHGEVRLRKYTERKDWIEIDDFPKAYFKGLPAQNYQVFSPKRKYDFRDRVITVFTLAPFPGCCAFAISTGVYVYAPFNNHGVNHTGNQLRQEIARQDGYTALICTDVDDNIPERKTLQRNGWQDILKVTNKRTGNIVNLSYVMLDR